MIDLLSYTTMDLRAVQASSGHCVSAPSDCVSAPRLSAPCIHARTHPAVVHHNGRHTTTHARRHVVADELVSRLAAFGTAAPMPQLVTSSSERGTCKQVELVHTLTESQLVVLRSFGLTNGWLVRSLAPGVGDDWGCAQDVTVCLHWVDGSMSVCSVLLSPPH